MFQELYQTLAWLDGHLLLLGLLLTLLLDLNSLLERLLLAKVQWQPVSESLSID